MEENTRYITLSSANLAMMNGMESLAFLFGFQKLTAMEMGNGVLLMENSIEI